MVYAVNLGCQSMTSSGSESLGDVKNEQILFVCRVLPVSLLNWGRKVAAVSAECGSGFSSQRPTSRRYGAVFRPLGGG